MQLLLTQSIPTTRKVRAEYSSEIGRLVTPRHYPSVQETIAEGITIAADNDGFNGVDFDAYRTMLDSLQPYAAQVAFVTVPDVVCDAAGTIKLWREWAPVLTARGFTPALVLQNGMVADHRGVRHGHEIVSWSEIGAIFIGGDNDYKLGVDAALIVHAARERGLWVHVGRVNSVRRLRHCMAIGASSCDGTGWARFKSRMLPLFAKWNADGCPSDLDYLTCAFPEDAFIDDEAA